MTAFLLTISFVLHALSLFIIILLYLQLAKIKEVEKRQAQIIEEMEQTVSAYFIEWKEENERFLQALSKTLHHRSSVKNEAKVEKSATTPNAAPLEQKESEWSPLAHVDEMKDTVEIRTIRPKPAPLSLAEQAAQLYKEGKTIEEIAKTLKKGKTEIELLLKFRQM
ncbi:hypothetical protein GGR02_000428 [Anoxybacillus voinovskiensis]|uniref:Swarming motility protein SwrB n=1 Tax=Anoxybacteroides voinovskiense TaxID=230470 RepID=A0A840DMF1_9BACL|nr:hypothetical protein [Anoxybacillus voinovskiensis]MBB4072682.1 hypothetical protein [Anoxybacillus voinovskiensis]GGJ56154.1 swarming motility protein SwrB [Anoxybacillus voinovskiensis]